MLECAHNTHVEEATKMGVRSQRADLRVDHIQTIPADPRCTQEHMCVHTQICGGHILSYKGSVSICCEHLVHTYVCLWSCVLGGRVLSQWGHHCGNEWVTVWAFLSVPV